MRHDMYNKPLKGFLKFPKPDIRGIKELEAIVQKQKETGETIVTPRRKALHDRVMKRTEKKIEERKIEKQRLEKAKAKINARMNKIKSEQMYLQQQLKTIKQKDGCTLRNPYPPCKGDAKHIRINPKTGKKCCYKTKFTSPVKNTTYRD